jgi:hypothetical protein
MEQNIIVGLITFFLGLILGHRLSLGRDKRKEFNDAAAPIREWILYEIDLFDTSAYNNPEPDIIQLDIFVNCLHWWHRKRFRDVYEKQKNARNKIYQKDGMFYRDNEAIVKYLHACLSYTNRK